MSVTYTITTARALEILGAVSDAMFAPSANWPQERAARAAYRSSVFERMANGTRPNVDSEQGNLWATILAHAADGRAFSVTFDIEDSPEGAVVTFPPEMEAAPVKFYYDLQGTLGVNTTWRSYFGAVAPDAESDIVVTPEDVSGFITISPREDLLETIPAGARHYARRTIERNARGSVTLTIADDGTASLAPAPDLIQNAATVAADLLSEAVTIHRNVVRARIRAPYLEEERRDEEARREHARRTARNFERFVRGRGSDEEAHVATLPFVPNGLSSGRRWGIEVESGGARDVPTPEGWRAVNDGSLRSAYEGYVEVESFEPYEVQETVEIGWRDCEAPHYPSMEMWDESLGYYQAPNPEYVDPLTCTDCGTVERTTLVEPQTIYHRARSGDCREFVSPILVSMHSRGLKQLCEALSVRPQNDSAGIHVHVEASDLSPDQVAAVVFGYDILEPLLESSYKRNRRDYCRRRSVDTVLTAARAAKGKVHQADISGGTRYLTLNTESLPRHGTLEFRAMGPVYEYDYLVRWAMLCRELVTSVANGATIKDFAKITRWEDLLSLLARFGKEFPRAAIYEMTGEVGEAARLEKAGAPVTTEALNLDWAALGAQMVARYSARLTALQEPVAVEGLVEV